jgi:glucokinase
MILAGDIGGTHSRLALFDVSAKQYAPVSLTVFPSNQYPSLDAIAAKYVEANQVHPEAACFGIAGPVVNGRVETTNLPWKVESQSLAAELRIPEAILINDLEANAWGIPALAAKDLILLNRVAPPADGNQAVISAGTGLGEAGIYWDGSSHHVFACEGGHSDFAPRNDLEVELFRSLQKQFGRVSYERLLSGPGLVSIFNFLRDSGRGAEPEWLREQIKNSDAAAAISRAAASATGEKCPLAEQALDVFIAIYGAEAGNLALKLLAIGGVFVGGGIAPKILPKLLNSSAFIQAFVSKGRMQPLMDKIPVKVIVNDETALLGAARYAAMNRTE